MKLLQDLVPGCNKVLWNIRISILFFFFFLICEGCVGWSEITIGLNCVRMDGLFCSALCLCSMEIGIEIRQTIVFLTSHPHINIGDQC